MCGRAGTWAGDPASKEGACAEGREAGTSCEHQIITVHFPPKAARPTHSPTHSLRAHRPCIHHINHGCVYVHVLICMFACACAYVHVCMCNVYVCMCVCVVYVLAAKIATGSNRSSSNCNS